VSVTTLANTTHPTGSPNASSVRSATTATPIRVFLDPSCGSGTFLSLCIRKAFDYADKHLVRPEELAAKLLNNIVGFDLNPLAVIAGPH